MRKYELISQAQFAKLGEPYQTVALPHTWNAADGHIGKEYWRGIGTYRLQLPAPTAGKRQYIELRGANHVATVYCNGRELGTHKGGFSTFRYELTDALLPKDNTLEVTVSNAESNIYPQHADFTFYGGLYRDVYFVEVEDAHFDLMKHGSEAVFVSAYSGGCTRLDLFPVNAAGCQVQLQLLDAEGKTVYETVVDAEPHTHVTTVVEDAHLWHGMEDPYLYTARATLLRNGEAIDQVTVTYGYRSFRFDAERGFFLNGKSVPLRGVCRHQDRENMGWAITKKEHKEDAELIREIGANTVRLAHYQHDQYFYDLCDQIGFAVWAEIPYISHHLPGKEAYDVTMSMMTELIAQCYNHPSIITWGIANEITIFNNCEEQYRNLCDLNALVKRLDPSRPTTMAQLSRLDITDQQIHITDIQSYNHYYGWYNGTVAENGPIFDKFHATHPDRVFGVSEYGAENILMWHSAQPFNHDYTEEYATFYHHEMLKIFESRPWIWATHAWNMFDFAAALRNEGGIQGKNNKGLVTYDRKIKKDAFYIYQAYWRKDPVVHIAGRRFYNRAPGERDVTVFTNAAEVTLLLNGKEVATLKPTDRAAVFADVALEPGENTLTARVAGAEDTITLCGAQEHDTSYDLPDLISAMQVGNWFAQQDEQEDYGDEGFNSEVQLKELLGNDRCMEIVRGWVMSLKFDLSMRFKFVSMLTAFRDNANYNTRCLRDMQTCKTYMQEADYETLNKLLRGVKRT